MFVSLLFFSFSSYSEIKIAFIDTGFCPHPNYSHVTFKPAFDTTDSIKIESCPKNYNDYPRFHGEEVIHTFLKQYTGKEKLIIFPIIVFDKNGKQSDDYWKKALRELEKIRPNIIISATGMINSEIKELSEIPKSIWFLSAARISPLIKKTDVVFPQNQYLKNNVFLFGTYFDGDLIDPGLLDSDHISLFVKDNVTGFNGSSYAVARISAELLSRCSLKKMNTDCFNKLSKEIKTASMLKNRGQ